MLGGGLQGGDNAVIVIIGVGVGLGEPDHFLAVHALTVDDRGDLTVTSAGVEADAAAIQMTADGLGKALLLGHLVHPHHLKGMLEHVTHVVEVEVPGAAGGIVLLHGVAHSLVAGQIHPEAALHPQQSLDDAVNIVDIRLPQLLRAVDTGAVNGHLAVGTFNGHIEGFFRVLQKRLIKAAQGNERGVQRGEMLDVHVDAEMLHGWNPPFYHKH